VARAARDIGRANSFGVVALIGTLLDDCNLTGALVRIYAASNALLIARAGPPAS